MQRGRRQGSVVAALSHDDYANLLAFRTALRRFDSWSHEQARQVGLTHAQHQLLLAVKGHGDPDGPTISEAAEYLNTRHHSAVGLVDRAERAGLLRRVRDGSDARAVRLQLTDLGEDRIAQLAELHLVELNRLAPVLQHLVGAARHDHGNTPPMSSAAVSDLAR
jgi:DNA-binding MarR family transcriptional regulator